MSFNRQRLTWQDRKASAHPAYPDEGPASPAYPGADPAADAYENGDPSSWAEDPHPGPYPNSAHPAYPDEGPASPAYKAAALERKAAKCIRLATALLGKKATVGQIEDKALELMDLSDRALHASLARFGGEEEEEVEVEEKEEAKKKAAEKEEEVEEVEEKEEASKKASALESRIARLERILVRLAGEEEEEEETEEVEEKEEASKKASSRKAMDWGMSDDEMLEAMLAEEGMMEKMSDEDLLEAMLAEEGMMDSEEAMMHKKSEEPPAMEEACGAPMPMEEEPEAMMDSEFDLDMSSDMEDPMGLLSEEMMGDEEQMILASIYGESAKAPAQKQASVKPQPKKPSTGATRLGGVTKEASAELDELSRLWESAPDISKHF